MKAEGRSVTTQQKRLLVIGASGFLGWNVAQIAQPQWTVLGTYHQHPVAIPGVVMHQLDCTQPGAIAPLLDTLKPDAVIHTAALSQPNACEQNPELSFRVNVTATVALANYCSDRQIPLAWTSSESVFDGLNPPYDEASSTCPVNRYGEHKVQAEQLILNQAPHTAICRMPLMFGPSPATAQSFLQPWLRSLRSGQLLNLFTDEYRMPVSATTAAQGLLLALEQKVSGLLHLSGSERLSRYELGNLIAEIWHFPPSLLQGCRQEDVAMAARRPRDLHLSNAKAIAFGYQPRSVREELLRLKDTLKLKRIM